MIHPSYVDLMKVVNKNVEEGETPVINSRYSIVMATAKRARQIVDGDEPLVKVSRGEKPLAIAIDELNQEEIRILAEDEIEEEYVDPSAEEMTGEKPDEEGAQEILMEEAAEGGAGASEDLVVSEDVAENSEVIAAFDENNGGDGGTEDPDGAIAAPVAEAVPAAGNDPAAESVPAAEDSCK